MKFIHIADVHLGAQPDAGPLYSHQRPRELWETFERVIRVCENDQTDLLLIAGDCSIVSLCAGVKGSGLSFFRADTYESSSYRRKS